MASVHYDDISYNSDVLLDLKFMESTGTITHDVGKPHHIITLNNTPTWTSIASGLQVLQFNGTTNYLDASNASTADLGFTTSDYTLSGWINWTDTGTTVKIFGRNEISVIGVGVGGWELYFYGSAGHNYLQLRHCHSAGATTTTGAFSEDWIPGTWWHFAVVRSGGACTHYRNGVALITSVSPGGLIDPEATTQDFVIGTRWTKNTDFYSGQIANLKICNATISASDIKSMYEIEKRWFT